MNNVGGFRYRKTVKITGNKKVVIQKLTFGNRSRNKRKVRFAGYN